MDRQSRGLGRAPSSQRDGCSTLQMPQSSARHDPSTEAKAGRGARCAVGPAACGKPCRLSELIQHGSCATCNFDRTDGTKPAVKTVVHTQNSHLKGVRWACNVEPTSCTCRSATWHNAGARVRQSAPSFARLQARDSVWHYVNLRRGRQELEGTPVLNNGPEYLRGARGRRLRPQDTSRGCVSEREREPQQKKRARLI